MMMMMIRNNSSGKQGEMEKKTRGKDEGELGGSRRRSKFGKFEENTTFTSKRNLPPFLLSTRQTIK